MGFTIFSSRLALEARRSPTYHENQALGQHIGRVNIRCTYRADSSKWTTWPKSGGGVHIAGLLYFTIEYNEAGAVPLRSATVEIDVGQSVNKSPVPIFMVCAPSSAITGAPFRQHVVDSRTTDPQAEITASGVGLRGSGYQHAVSAEFDEDHRWSFKAGHLSDQDDTRVTKADFTWKRTLLQDCTGLDRSYDGALVLHRDVNDPITLRVRVKAQPWKRLHRVLSLSPKDRDSHPIGPDTDTTLERTVFENHKSAIQETIVRRNIALASTEIPNVNIVGATMSQITDVVSEERILVEGIPEIMDVPNTTNLTLNMLAEIVDQAVEV